MQAFFSKYEPYCYALAQVVTSDCLRLASGIFLTAFRASGAILEPVPFCHLAAFVWKKAQISEAVSQGSSPVKRTTQNL